MKHLDFALVEKTLLGAYAPDDLTEASVENMNLPGLGSTTDIEKFSLSILQQQASVDSVYSLGQLSTTKQK